MSLRLLPLVVLERQLLWWVWRPCSSSDAKQSPEKSHERQPGRSWLGNPSVPAFALSDSMRAEETLAAPLATVHIRRDRSFAQKP